MNACLECLPCLAKNAVDVGKRITDDLSVRRCILSYAMRMLSDCDCTNSPPFYAGDILRNAQALSGMVQCDPYKDEKIRSTRLAEELLVKILEAGYYHPEDFASRVRLAVAGNILDFGIYADMDLKFAMDIVAQAFTKKIDEAAIDRIQELMEKSKRILYLLDNSGEAVFDREFMKPYREKITIGVRGAPVFNDVTEADLLANGLENFASAVVINASDIPGTILERAGKELQQVFWESDLVIAKGQGNFESLDEVRHPIAFLFMAKCPVVARLLNCELNSLQVRLH